MGGSPTLQASAIEGAVEYALTERQAAWPVEVVLRFAPRSTFDALVAQFAPAFSTIPDSSLERLATFCRLYAGSVLLHDGLLDGDIHARDVGLASMRVVAMQHEAHDALRGLFGEEARFWRRLRGQLLEYAQAFVAECAFRNGRPPHELTQPAAITMAIGKHGIAKSIVAALCELGEREDLYARLCAAIDAVAVATQMRDDLEDWRLDLWTRTPSLLLARLPPEVWALPVREKTAEIYERVGRLIYRGGHAAHVLRLAHDTLDEVDLATLPAIPWCGLIRRLRARCSDMTAMIEDAGGSAGGAG